MNSESRLISLIIKQVIYGRDNKELIDFINAKIIDWRKTRDLIIYHELGPFAYFCLKDLNGFLPQDLREFLKNSYTFYLFRSLVFRKEFLRIYEAFWQARINIVPIKGMALIQDVYFNVPPRPMVDIDLLVNEDDLQKSESVFYGLGYRKELYGLKEEYWRKKQCHIAFYNKEKRSPYIELHWGLDFKRKNCNMLPRLWNRIREINTEGQRIKVLSPEDTLFSLALHQRRYGKVLSLKNVLDLGLLFNIYGNSFEWDYVLEESQNGHMSSAIFYLIYLAQFFLETPIPERVWKGLGVSFYKRILLKNFIEKNTLRERNKNINKKLYLKSHFLLYNSLWEPIDYIMNIPQEQFAKFYNLEPYDNKTALFYKYRLLYIPLKAFSNFS